MLPTQLSYFSGVINLRKNVIGDMAVRTGNLARHFDTSSRVFDQQDSRRLDPAVNVILTKNPVRQLSLKPEKRCLQDGKRHVPRFCQRVAFQTPKAFLTCEFLNNIFPG